MKIGIMTFWWDPDSYGQVLQCFALQRYLIINGHEPFLIRYRPQHGRKNNTSPIPRLHPRRILRSVKGAYFSYKRHKKHKRILDFNSKNPRYFDEFFNKRIIFTDDVFDDYTSLELNAPHADAYITGSDQVWNIGAFDENSSPWFLEFCCNDSKKIAYAASFGRSSLSDCETNEIRPYLSGFNHIGVREDDGVLICQKAGRSNCQHVLDPTFLLTSDDYHEIFDIGGDSSKTYDSSIFAYVLSGECVPWDELKTWASRMNLEILPIPAHGSNLAMPFSEFFTPSIDEWIVALAQSRYSVVTSFHGMVFSIIFEKKFLVCVPEKWDRGSRITSLLGELGLTDRIYSPDSGSFSEQIEAPIDWVGVRGILDQEIEMSTSFLADALDYDS